MATATGHKTITKVILELTADEAHTLASLLGSVTGDVEKSARKYVNDVKKALNGAGFDYWSSPFSNHITKSQTLSGVGIHFTNHTPRENS